MVIWVRGNVLPRLARPFGPEPLGSVLGRAPSHKIFGRLSPQSGIFTSRLPRQGWREAYCAPKANFVRGHCSRCASVLRCTTRAFSCETANFAIVSGSHSQQNRHQVAGSCADCGRSGHCIGHFFSGPETPAPAKPRRQTTAECSCDVSVQCVGPID